MNNSHKRTGLSLAALKHYTREQLQHSWQRPNLLTWLLWPLSQLYKILFKLNRCAFSIGLRKAYRAPVPVIVVGNITVGGTGKTPMVIYLIEVLKKQGYQPGVISRGYAGNATTYPLLVTAQTDAKLCGDEPALIVRRTAVPMVVGPNRQADIEHLLARHDIDIIISDDGLQHHALERDIEICLLDRTNQQQNNKLLPAGPFRESPSRLDSVDLLVEHTALAAESAGAVQPGLSNKYQMYLEPSTPVLLADMYATEKTKNKRTLDVTGGVHAVAGIGNPQRFFNTCRALGWQIEAHAFADHHRFVEADFAFADQKMIVITEKDAVKCQQLVNSKLWFLPVDATLSSGFEASLANLIKASLAD